MSHALLLRLFLSPYFSISVAMHYLKTYPDSIGISHYLCWRMKYMPAEEVEFYWPQICHLMITYPTTSNALESFVLDRAEESTHSAMLTFWFMQSALRDLTPTRKTNPGPFLICQRILSRCHEIIFGDNPDPSHSPYRSLPHSNASTPKKSRQPKSLRVNPHAGAALIGMGVMLAAPGMRGLSDLAGGWAVRQGRRPMDDDEGRSRVEVDKAGGSDGRQLDTQNGSESGRHSADVDADDAQDSAGEEQPTASTLQQHGRPSTPLSAANRFSQAAATTPNLYSPPGPQLSSPTLSRSSTPQPKGTDPFSQLSPNTSASTPGTPSRHQPFHSVPEFVHSNGRLTATDRPPPPEVLLAAYSMESQRQLLRSHYCRSEIRFLLLLEDISNRLLVIPKPARVSALRAELTGLNHNLPAEICMPLWCAADHCHEEGGQTSAGNPLSSRPDNSRKRGHSRVVRISPGDSVVLNSAERAPFLLHVELLDGDLDFDPTRRENRELLKKIVVQEDLKRRKGEGYTSSTQQYPPPRPLEAFGGGAAPSAPASGGTGTSLPSKAGPSRPETLSRDDSAMRKNMMPDDVEEMDLVEQMYGSKLSVKDVLPDWSETMPLPQGPKNKALDAAAWDRAGGTLALGYGGSPLLDVGGGGAGPETVPSRTATPNPPSPGLPDGPERKSTSGKRVITLEDYSERMRTAAVMLAQLNASMVASVPEPQHSSSGALSWIPGTGWIKGSAATTPPSQAAAMEPSPSAQGQGGKLRLAAAQAAAIRDRIMEEMMALEEERVARMTERPEGAEIEEVQGENKTAEDESIVRRELNKADPSAAVFKESWQAKMSRIRASSPWGHLANWNVISVIVKTGTDLRQEQLATQLIERFSRIWKEEKSDCWARFFRILITGEQSGLVETITDAVSVHSIKKGEYARRVAAGEAIGTVSLMDHFVGTYGKPDSGRFARAQRNFIKSLAGYSVITYLLQIKDRHNGNILVDRDGHLIHIDFGFMLSNSPGGNMGFEAAPFKLPLDYVDIMGGLDSAGWIYFKKLFKEGFECARKHSDSLITIVELMQKNSRLDCFTLFGEQTALHFRERFALGLTTAAVDAHLERLIVSSTGSNYTRMYDTFQYYSQGVL